MFQAEAMGIQMMIMVFGHSNTGMIQMKIQMMILGRPGTRRNWLCLRPRGRGRGRQWLRTGTKNHEFGIKHDEFSI